MNKDKIVKSISYCGLVCNLCHLADKCDGCKNTASHCDNHSGKWEGCKNTASHCDNHSGKWEGCYHRNCCIKNKLNGCWECKDFPCNNDMFSDTHDLRIRAFVRFIKEEGLAKLAECLIENEKRGVKYGFKKDYDFKENEAQVLALLRTGKK